MATQNLHGLMSKADAGAVEYLAMQLDGGAPAASSGAIETGWVGASGSTAPPLNSHAEIFSLSIRGVASFDTTTPKPTSPENVNGNAYRTPTLQTGTYAAGAWNISQTLISALSGWNGRHRYRIRVFKGANANGSGATEITTSYTFTPTGGVQTTGNTLLSDLTTANVTLGSTDTRSLSWAAPAITLTNEYLFFALALEITTRPTTVSGGRELHLRQGTGTLITTPDFVVAAPSGVPYACGLIGV